jgi:hypothetical protein
LVGIPQGKRPIGRDLGVDGRIILKWVLINRVGGSGLNSYGLE